MAGDWIKMRTDLYRDPKVCVIADLLMDEKGELSRYVNQNKQRDMAVTRNVMRNVTVGALVSVWGVLRHRGKRVESDLAVNGCNVSIIDDLADLPGFGEAMATVGWVVEVDAGIVLPRFFEEFNVDPEEEAKQKNAERQRRFRAKQGENAQPESNVTVTLKSNAREEKRRVTTPYPAGFLSVWEIYPPQRRVGKPKCLEIWVKNLLEAQAPAIALHVEAMKLSPQWQKDGGQFVPTLQTYLNQGRFEDGAPAAEAKRLAI
jgi:hypothetical protein